jgi:hypothetical protein
MQYTGSQVRRIRFMWVHVVVWFRSIPAFWIARTSDDGQVICKSAALPYQFIFISPTYLSNSRGTDAPGLWLNVCSKSPTDPLLIALLSPYCTQLRKEHKSAFLGGVVLSSRCLKFTGVLECLAFQLNASVCPFLSKLPLFSLFPI